MSDILLRIAARVGPVHRPLAVAVQLGFVVLSNRLAFLLRFDADVPHWADEAFWLTLPWLVAIRALTFVPFRLYEGLWRYTSVYDLRAIAGGVAASSLLFFLFVQSPLGPAVYPRSIFIVDALLLTLLLGGIRMSRRVATGLSRATPGKRILIFGAGDAGELIVRDMTQNPSCGYQPIGFVDDDPANVGHRIHGVPVLGTRAELPDIFVRWRPDEVLLAVPHAEPAVVRSIVRALEPFRVPIKTLPKLQDLLDGRIELSQIRGLAVEDLLARPPVGLDTGPVRRLIAGRRVLVTGAGGSIGSELCRQIARFRPASLVMLERHENSLHAIRMELEDGARAPGVHAIVADVTERERVRDVLQEHRPEILFHAAAHKHVPLMEEHPCEAIKNNVRGTRILAEAADEAGVDRFIMISTDKAVNPTSVMGASKRLAELAVQRHAAGSGTAFAVVRFGNVLASNGSVVPRFVEQIKRGGPVTVTHPDIRRFFMLIPEAVQLVLHAAAQAESGATYVLEMGEQVKLVDMARDLIRLSGFVPDEEIPIAFVGLRPGEKLYEELVGGDEEVGPSAVDKILRVTSRRPPPGDLMESIARIETAAAAGQTDTVRQTLVQLVGLSSLGGGSAPDPDPDSHPSAHSPAAPLLPPHDAQDASWGPRLAGAPCAPPLCGSQRETVRSEPHSGPDRASAPDLDSQRSAHGPYAEDPEGSSVAGIESPTPLSPLHDPQNAAWESPLAGAPCAPAIAPLMAMTTPSTPAREGPVEQPCPACQSSALHRSRARTLAERLRRSYSDKRLFRCTSCDWRGWLVPLDFGAPGAAEPVLLPDLVALDSAVQGFQAPSRPTFSPRDLR
jgi:FlaA1/EpsC-like NDP-sugar epimerase